jgi:hypothetical protein
MTEFLFLDFRRLFLGSEVFGVDEAMKLERFDLRRFLTGLILVKEKKGPFDLKGHVLRWCKSWFSLWMADVFLLVQV